MRMNYRYLPDYAEPLKSRIVELHRTRPDLQAAFPELDSAEYLRWINVDAYMADEEVRKSLPPIPPPERMSVVSIGGVPGFLVGGFSAFAALQRAAERVDRTLDSFGEVLDFGCGAGRTLRYWAPYAKAVRLSGCDVDSAAVGWVDETFDFVAARVNSTAPPLPYHSGRFDLIYSISVFSHLSEPGHLGWIDELARIARPGAHLVLTTHGERALQRLVDEPERRELVGLGAEQVLAARQAVDETGYAFCGQDGVANPDLYGMTFISEGYVRSYWSGALEVVDYEPEGIDGWQDVVTLRKRD
jgi:SAM-dependent methyltransferase